MNNSNTPEPVLPKDSEIVFNDIVKSFNVWKKYLLSKWLIILILGLLGGIIGLLYSWYRRPVYTAEISFALETDKGSGGLGGALGLASQFGFDLGGSGGGAFTGDNLIVLMQSRSMVEKALLTPVNINGKSQTLADYYIEFNKFRSNWGESSELYKIHYLPGADRSKFSRTQDSLLGLFHSELIKKSLSVSKEDKRLSIITVKLKSVDELFAKYFSEVLVKEVSDFYVDTKTKKSVSNLSILQHQTDSVRRELNQAISGVASSSDVNPNPNPSRQILRVPSLRRQVDVQANQAILTELVKNLEISKVSLRRETPLIQIIDMPILPLERDRVGKLKGIVVGGTIFGFLTVVFLIFKRLFYLNVTNE